MARLITASFDTGLDSAEIGGHLVHNYGVFSADISGLYGISNADFVKSGVRSLGVYSNGLFSVSDSLVTGLATNDWVVDRVYFFKFHLLYIKGDNPLHSGYSSSAVNDTWRAEYDPTNRPVFVVSAVEESAEFHTRLVFDSVGHLVVEHNNASAGAVTSSIALDEGTWYEIRIEFKISDSPNGYMKVWIDGTLDIDDSGVDTRYNAGDFVYWKFGHFMTGLPLYGYDHHYDNLFVNDDQGASNNGHLLDGLVLYIFPPISDAGPNEWFRDSPLTCEAGTGAVGMVAACQALIDLTGEGTTDGGATICPTFDEHYIYILGAMPIAGLDVASQFRPGALEGSYRLYSRGDMVGDQEVFNFGDIAAVIGANSTGVAVHVLVFSSAINAVTGLAKGLLKVGGTDYLSSNVFGPKGVVDLGYGLGSWYQNPDTVSAWTSEELNSVQAGAERIDSELRDFNLTHLFVMVECVPVNPVDITLSTKGKVSVAGDLGVTAKGKVSITNFVSRGVGLPHVGQGMQFDDWVKNPNTDAAWTQIELDALQMGVESVDLGGGPNQVSVDGVYLIVEHDETRDERRDSLFGAKAQIQLSSVSAFIAKSRIFVPGDAIVGSKMGFFSGNRIFPIPPPRLEVVDADTRIQPEVYP